MKLPPALLLGLAQGGFAPAARSFRKATLAPAATQARLLDELSRRCAATEYGAHYGVKAGDDLRTRLPIVSYDTLKPWLDLQRETERSVLTHERVIFYEKTSGSTAPAKHIPYTSSLRRSFTRMFAIWAHDLLTHGPRFTRGTLYFSVSPRLLAPEYTARGLKVGLDDDADYLGPFLKRALSTFIVDDRDARSVREPEAWKRAVARALVLRPDLEIISVWNPSMLLILLDHIERHRHELSALLVDSPRACALTASQVDWCELWPNLRLVSCWDGASAAPLARALQARLPHVMLQGKGLLSTEAPITVPLIAAGGCVPMLDEVFIELEDISSGECVLLHEALPDRVYELIISQRGGLCRYRMGDRVRVTHRYGRTPCLEFLGRGADTSDLVGEKLQEDFVTEALGTASIPATSFRALLPRRAPHDHYLLILDREPADRELLAAQVDLSLSAAHHYAHARSLGQLGPVRIKVLEAAPERVRDMYLRRGMKWGDVKPRTLHTNLAADPVMEGTP